MMSFFRNLSLGKKLALAILVFNFSTALLMYYLITEKDGLIDFTKQEIDGVEYLRAAQAGMQALTSLTLSSDALSTAAAKLKQAQIDDNGALSVGPKSDDTQASLLSAVSKGNADGIAKTTDLISTISDNSNITLDPDADAYFVGDILVNQATALLAQTNALIGAAHDLDADKSDDHKIAYAEARDGISAAAGTFASDLAKALKGNQDGSVKDKLTADGTVVAAAVDKVVAASKTEDRAALTSASSELLKSVNGFVIKDAEEMTHLLNGRINGFHSVMITQTTIVLLLLFAGAVISWFVTRSVTKPINLITGLMGRLTKGDLDIEVPQDNRTDEIGGLIVALKGFYEASVERDKARQSAQSGTRTRRNRSRPRRPHYDAQRYVQQLGSNGSREPQHGR